MTGRVWLLVQHEDGSIQHRGECHPDGIGRKQQRRHAIEPPRGGDESEDDGEKRKHDREREADAVEYRYLYPGTGVLLRFDGGGPRQWDVCLAGI